MLWGSGDLWGVLACVGMLPTTGHYWNHLERIRPYKSALPPIPETHSCTDVQLPPLHTIHSHALLWGPLGCVGMRWHSHYYWLLLEHIGTTWNLYDPIRTVLDSPGCALPTVQVGG